MTTFKLNVHQFCALRTAMSETELVDIYKWADRWHRRGLSFMMVSGGKYEFAAKRPVARRFLLAAFVALQHGPVFNANGSECTRAARNAFAVIANAIK